MPEPSAKEMMRAFDVIRAAKREDLETMAFDTEIVKAAQNLHGPEAGLVVRDVSHDPHGEGPRGRGVIGPAQEASGGGTRRMAAEYSPDAIAIGFQSLADQLGAALEGVGDAVKALQAIARKATRDEDDLNETSRRKAKEDREEDEEAERSAHRGADKARRPPVLSRASNDAVTRALIGDQPLEGSIRDLFSALMGNGAVGKANIVIAKAGRALHELHGNHVMAAQRLLQHASACAAGCYSQSNFAREIAMADGDVVRAMLAAIRG